MRKRKTRPGGITPFTMGSNELPCCGKRMDCVSNLERDTQPKSGDPTLCIYCGAILIFEDERAAQRVASANDLIMLQIRHPESYRKILHVQAGIRNLRADGVIWQAEGTTQ